MSQFKHGVTDEHDLIQLDSNHITTHPHTYKKVPCDVAADFCVPVDAAIEVRHVKQIRLQMLRSLLRKQFEIGLEDVDPELSPRLEMPAHA